MLRASYVNLRDFQMRSRASGYLFNGCKTSHETTLPRHSLLSTEPAFMQQAIRLAAMEATVYQLTMPTTYSTRQSTLPYYQHMSQSYVRIYENAVDT